MFNDDLLVDECKKLIRKLGFCHLPFQCAHGRPSMVPVANLEAITTLGDKEAGHVRQASSGDHYRPKDFSSAWKEWSSILQT
jgi:hypothetical protein